MAKPGIYSWRLLTDGSDTADIPAGTETAFQAWNEVTGGMERRMIAT